MAHNSFAPRSGCPMCSIVSTSSSLAIGSRPDILWRDENVTVYREKSNPVSSKAHIIVALNVHAPSIYSLSSSDLPLLVNIRNTATRLLSSLITNHARPSTPNAMQASLNSGSPFTPLAPDILAQLRIGFITPPFKDTKIPVTDHLHCHAYVAPADLLGWWRGIAYGPLAWYSIDDLIAEIRESVSNNRVKSGYLNRMNAPIDLVPAAGSREGTADGRETTTTPMSGSQYDIEEGGISPDMPVPPSPGGIPATPGPSTNSPAAGSSRSSSPSSSQLTPQSAIPSLSV
ncbi:hypothetical protein DL96DRAFT_54082 [Flagelloscypha sp. PMI_526]|nr:hypothetical protein DL96DRAFT_54082 [Flagelloscypha sp. PMI_526]